jgi:hypothetical protein
MIFYERCHPVVAEGCAITVIMAENSKGIAVIPIQSVGRAEPHEPTPILQKILNTVL